MAEGLKVGRAGRRWRSAGTCTGDLGRHPAAVARMFHHFAQLPVGTSAQDGGRQGQRGVWGCTGVPHAWPRQLLQKRQGGLCGFPGPPAAQCMTHGFRGQAVPERPAHGLPGQLEPDLHGPAAVAAPVHQADSEPLSWRCRMPAEAFTHRDSRSQGWEWACLAVRGATALSWTISPGL